MRIFLLAFSVIFGGFRCKIIKKLLGNYLFHYVEYYFKKSFEICLQLFPKNPKNCRNQGFLQGAVIGRRIHQTKWFWSYDFIINVLQAITIFIERVPSVENDCRSKKIINFSVINSGSNKGWPLQKNGLKSLNYVSLWSANIRLTQDLPRTQSIFW